MSIAWRGVLYAVVLTSVAAGGADAAAASGSGPAAAVSREGPELRSADAPFTETVTVPDGASGLTTWLRCGPGDGLSVVLQTRDGGRKALTLRLFDQAMPSGKGELAAPSLPEAGIEIPELKLRCYVRPKPAMLKPEPRRRLVEDWSKLPAAGKRRFPLGFRHGSDGVVCFVDGLYAGRVFPSGRLAAVTFTVRPGSAVGPSRFDDGTAAPGFLPVELDRFERPGGWATAAVSMVEPGVLGQVPFRPPTAASLELGRTAGQQSLYESYTDRSAFDGLGESFILTVPSAQYIRAWVLCTVDPDAAKDPAMTVRITRFVSPGPYAGRGRDALADTTVILPRGNDLLGAGVTRVGMVTVNGTNLPLYAVEVPLKSGEIQDLLFHEQGSQQRGALAIGPYLDLELLGRLRPQERSHPFVDDRFYPDSRSVSGVHVHAVTLEATPVEMEVRSTQPGNVFHNQETPELSVALRPRQDGAYRLTWTIRDVDGREVGAGREEIRLAAGAPERTVPVALAQPRLGWYEIELRLWQGERQLLSHQAAFALLGPDTRQAGYESPYGSWWFYYHYGTRDPSIVGPLLLKAGFRRAGNGVACCSEADLAPWKVTAPAVGWGALRDPAATDAQIEAHIRDWLARYPHCQSLMIFHESMPNAPLGTRSAPELFGLPVREYPGADERWQQATRLARLTREKFPQLQIDIGNSGASSELIAEGLRRGFPRDAADCIGIETVGRTGHPEKLWEGGLQGVWLLREIARQKGYDWRVTSCFETNYRQDRLLGAQRQAEWYVRDVLLSHAYRFPYISIGLLHDVGNSYHASFWGSTGLCRRYPLLYPKKAYVAMATVTRVLDRVTLRRELPTGSNSVYALEFARADGSTVYALWTARGTCDLTLTWRADGTGELVDLYGRAVAVATAARQLRITAGTAVQYLVTAGEVESIVCGRRAYPDDQPPSAVQWVNAMDRVEEWQLATAKDPLLEQVTAPHLPFRTAGDFVLRGVDDEERGRCLELELRPRPDLPTPLLSQYAVLRLREPVTLPGAPTTLGVWVKGNSGWGQVYWEIEDANGVRRASCGTVVHDADVFDYDGRVSVNFDGWAFLHFPITDKSPIPDLSTGSVANLWEASDRSRPVTYPIRLTGLAVAVPQQTLRLTEMVPVAQALRFRDLGAYE